MNNDKTELMENAPVKQAILKLALPTMLSMAVVMIYNLTDTFFIGQLNDPNLVAALSLAGPIFMSIQAFGNIFANGAASYISRKLGAKEGDEAKRTSSVAIYTSIIVGAVITALLLVFRAPILAAIGTSDATYEATSAYYTIISTFAIIFILQINFSGLIRSEGATDKAMIGMILGIGLNIVLDPIFIFVFNMGVAGAAWATAVGNGIGAIYFVSHFLSRKTLLSIKLHDFKPSKKIYGETFKIGIPSALGNLVMSFSMILVNIIAATYGDHVVAGNGIQMRVASMCFMITLLYATILGVFFAAIFLLFGEQMISLFIKDPATVEAGAKILRAFSCAVPFIGLQMTLMITFQSVGKAMKSLIISLGRQCIIYLPALFILNSLFGFNGFILAQPLADVLTAVVAVLMSVSFFKEMNQKHEEKMAVQEDKQRA